MSKSSIKTNFIFNSLFQLSGILIPVITMPYLTRTLHAQGLGEYSFAYSVAYYFYMIIKLGLHNYGNRTVAFVKDNRFELSKTFWNIYVFQLFMGIVMSMIYIGYCIIIATNQLLAFIFFIMVFAGGFDITWALYGLEEFKITSLRDITIKIVTAACVFLFVKTEADVWKYVLIFSFGFLVSQLVSIPVLLKKVDFVKPEFKAVLSHIKPNLVLFLPTVAVSIYKTMDKIMLGAMTSETELGYYHSSERVIEVPLALITALGMVMMPRMSNLLSKNEDDRELRTLFDKSIIFAMFISSSVCMGIMTVAREFVPLFFGQGFEKCITLFYIILPSCIFLAFANVIRTQYLLPRKKDKVFIISLFTGAGVNLLLNLYFIPKFASIGAAIGTLTAEIVVCIFQAVYVSFEEKLGKNVMDSMPFIIAGVLMFMALRNYSPTGIDELLSGLLVKIVICGFFYLGVLGGIIILKRFSTRWISSRSYREGN